MIDLHVHSTYSDGTFTVQELVDYAVEKGLKAIALTDHDTVDGLDEIREYAKGKDIEIVPGIEFSTDLDGKDIHILGYYMDYKSEKLLGRIKEFVASRNRRNVKMCGKLAEAGCPFTYEEISERFKGAVVTRAHFAAYLIEKGYVKSREEAFERYIGDKARCYVPQDTKITPFEAVKLISEVGGIPVLAHPFQYKMSDARLSQFVGELKEAGLIGIETIYSKYTAGEIRQLKSLAKQYDLLITGGSDFHGANKPKIDLGTGHGSLEIPDEILDNLKKCLAYYVFSDMDGTLFDEKCIFSDALKDSIREFVERGNFLVPTTGRPYKGTINAFIENDMVLPDMKVICSNGALIIDVETETPVIEFKLTSEEIREVIKKADEVGIYVHSYDDDNIVLREETEETRFYTRKVHMPLKFVDDIADELKDGALKLMCIDLNNKPKLEAFRTWIHENMGDRLQGIFSNDRYMEVLSVKAGKGNGIKAFCRLNHIPIGRTYACGDQENDIDMIKAAGCGVAVANATAEAKAAADVITKDDASHDALKPLFDSI